MPPGVPAAPPSTVTLYRGTELPSTKDLDPRRCRKKTSRMIKDPKTTTCCGPSDSLHHAGTLTFLYILVLYWQNTYLFYYNKKPSQYIFKVHHHCTPQYNILYSIFILFYTYFIYIFSFWTLLSHFSFYWSDFISCILFIFC